MSNKVSGNKRILKNTMFLYIRMLLVMLVSLYTVRVVLNVLGANDYGIYNVVCGIVIMFSFLSRTLASSSQRYFAYELGRGDSEKLNNVFSITVTLYLIVVGIIFLLAESLGLWFINFRMTIPPDRLFAANVIYQFSILSFCFTILMTPYQAMLIAREDMNVYAFLGIIEVVLYLAVAIVLNMVSGDRLIVYGILMTFVAILVNSVYYVYSRVKYPETRFNRYWDSKLAKEITSYSVWNIFGAIANVLRSQGINMLISAFFSPAITAARAIAYQVSGALNSFASNFYTAVRPQVTKKYASGDVDGTNSLIFMSSKLSYYLILFLAIPIIIYIEQILQIWLVDVPAYTSLFVVLVIVVALVDSLSNPLMTLAQATGNVKLYQIVVSFLLVLNLPMSWVALKVGCSAEYTMYVAICLSIILLFARLLVLKRIADFPVFAYCKQILSRVFIASIVCVIVDFLTKMYIYNLLPKTFFVLAVSLAFSALVNIAIILYIGLNVSERQKISSTIKSKIFKR